MQTASSNEPHGTPSTIPLDRWIRENRGLIDTVIRMCVRPARRINDHERRLWVLNHEPLYLTALDDGVRV